MLSPPIPTAQEASPIRKRQNSPRQPPKRPMTGQPQTVSSQPWWGDCPPFPLSLPAWPQHMPFPCLECSALHSPLLLLQISARCCFFMEAFSESPGLAFSLLAQLPAYDVLPHSCHWPLYRGFGIPGQRSVSEPQFKPTSRRHVCS